MTNPTKKAKDDAQRAKDRAKKREHERLAFLEKRDGKAAMLAWAEQSLAIYVDRSIIEGRFEDSIEVFTDILKENGRDVKMVAVTGSCETSE